MIDLHHAFVDDVLDPLGVYVGFLMLIPIIHTWWQVTLGARRRHSKWLEEMRKQSGKRPAILVVDLLPAKDVSTQVKAFVARHGELADIPDDRWFSVTRDTMLTDNMIPALYREIRKVAATVAMSGADKVHLFYAGPVIASAWLGAEFANAGCQVMLYQNQSGDYINFGPLRHHV